MYLNLIIILLIIISALAKAGADYTAFNTSYLLDRYQGQERSWFDKYLPFLGDVWHRYDYIRTLMFCIAVAVAQGFVWWSILVGIVYSAFYGIIFEIGYNLKKKREL